MKVLVTGGGGFLGRALVKELLYQGHVVRSFARSDYPELRDLGVETHRGDLAEFSDVEQAVAGMDAVFHVGAKAGVWGSYHSYYRANVLGTQNILDACRLRNVNKLIYTSTPSVTFDGQDQEGVDESAPIPDKFLSHYPKTKAIAERLVLEANDDELITVALRPHLIWGPGDTQLVPRILDRARRGRLRIVGSGEKQVDATYIDNVVDAHLLAAYKLEPGATCAGKAYFITNDEPWLMVDILNGILSAGGLPALDKHIPEGVAYALGATLETIYGLLKITKEPPMTRFVARQLATAHWYDISAAKRDLDYGADVSMDEGMQRLAEAMETNT